MTRSFALVPLCLIVLLALTAPAAAQTPPSGAEIAAYRGLHAAAARGDAGEIERLVRAGTPIDARDRHGRTPLHVAVFMRKQDAARTLLRLRADPNALESQQYDIVTIAAVADDVPMLRIALDGGCRPNNITSPYQGTALIAAAHLGHVEVVRTLIAAGAPLDHVNNLGWTALIESIVLGDGGKASYRRAQASCRCRRRRPSPRSCRRHAARAREEPRLGREGNDPRGCARALCATRGTPHYARPRALARPAGQRQPHPAANPRHARQPAEPSCRRPLQEQSAARTGGNRPAGVRDRGHRDRNGAHHRKLIPDRQIRIDKLRQEGCEERNGFWVGHRHRKAAPKAHVPARRYGPPFMPACRHD